jgi:hypothetical protein
MLFHTGALMRLNELGLLKQLRRVSSVSGGSISAGYLGFVWKRLNWDTDNVATNFAAEYVEGILQTHLADGGASPRFPCLPSRRAAFPGLCGPYAGTYHRHPTRYPLCLLPALPHKLDCLDRIEVRIEHPMMSPA